MEEEKCQSLDKLKSESLPSKCSNWIKTTSTASADFVVLFSSDFRPKLAKELADIEEEQRDALKCLKEAQDSVGQFSDVILKNLKELLIYFKHEKAGANDPWINELTIRHFSAKFLDRKAEYLVTLYRIYTQIRHLHTELNHKLAVHSDEFLRILERFDLAQSKKAVDHQIDFGSLAIANKSSGNWDSVLKNYSLDYDWKLTCPPLDGFLSTLYTHLKSLGASFSLEIDNENVPKIFSENSLRFGFLQKMVSGILTRNWQVNFAILQPSTGFLHLYKVNKDSSNNCNSNSNVSSGNLLVPSIGNSYTKSSLHDLNILATQFYLQSPHHPAAISPQTLSPSLSVPLASNCKIVASDPAAFVFSIKPPGGEKVNLKAFCEEEFVDWVIFLNETVKKTKVGSKSSTTTHVKGTEDASIKNITHSKTTTITTYTNDTKSPSSSSSSSDSSTPVDSEIIVQIQQNTTSSTFSSVAPIVDLENPWE